MTAVEVIREIEKMIDRALLVDAPGDKIADFIVGETPGWFTADNQPGTITLNITKDDFYARSLNIFLSARLVDNAAPLNNSTERTFRPNSWTSTANALQAGVGVSGVAQDANCTWLLSDTYNGTYQGNAPLVAAAAYSSRYGQGSVRNEGITSAWVGARPFFVPYKLKRGSAATVIIQPTFGRAVNATVKTQFRATLLLSGYKILRRPT